MEISKTESIQFFAKSDKPYGISYASWTEKWWQWIMNLPKKNNPLLDYSGNNWDIMQPSSDVFYLVGNFAKEDNVFPSRNVRMSAGRSILFPVLNCIASLLEYPELKDHDDLRYHVNYDVETIVKNNLFINGTKFESIRVPSEGNSLNAPGIFQITINKENAFNIVNTGLTDAAADGFWVFLKPLPKGEYNIKFEGSCESGRLNAGANYKLEIV